MHFGSLGEIRGHRTYIMTSIIILLKIKKKTSYLSCVNWAHANHLFCLFAQNSILLLYYMNNLSTVFTRKTLSKYNFFFFLSLTNWFMDFSFVFGQKIINVMCNVRMHWWFFEFCDRRAKQNNIQLFLVELFYFKFSSCLLPVLSQFSFTVSFYRFFYFIILDTTG